MGNRRINISFFILALLLVVVYMLIEVGSFSSGLLIIALIIAIPSLIIFFTSSNTGSLKRYYLKPSNIFILAYFIVNFQYLIDFWLGYKSPNTRFIPYSETLNNCTVLGLIGLLSYISGYNSKYGYVISKLRKNIYKIKRNKEIYKKAKWALIILQLSFFIGFLLTINIIAFITGMEYGDNENPNSIFEDLLYISNILIILNVIINNNITNVSKYVKSFPIISLTIIVIYMIMRLMSGDRGPFMYTALLLFFGYSYAGRKNIKIKKILILMGVGVFGMSIIGIARSLDTNDSFSSRVSNAMEMFSKGGRFGDGEEKQSIFSPTEELGFSFIVNQVAVKTIEEDGIGYNYGAYTIYTLLCGIPYMPGIIQNQFHVKPENSNSVSYIDYHYFGTRDNTWSLGTSVLSDFYLQLGAIGVLLGLFITGVIFRYVDLTIYVINKNKISVYSLLFALTFASKALYIPRAILFADLARFIWGSIIIWILIKLLSIRK